MPQNFRVERDMHAGRDVITDQSLHHINKLINGDMHAPTYNITINKYFITEQASDNNHNTHTAHTTIAIPTHATTTTATHDFVTYDSLPDLCPMSDDEQKTSSNNRQNQICVQNKGDIIMNDHYSYSGSAANSNDIVHRRKKRPAPKTTEPKRKRLKTENNTNTNSNTRNKNRRTPHKISKQTKQISDQCAKKTFDQLNRKEKIQRIQKRVKTLLPSDTYDEIIAMKPLQKITKTVNIQPIQTKSTTEINVAPLGNTENNTCNVCDKKFKTCTLLHRNIKGHLFVVIGLDCHGKQRTSRKSTPTETGYKEIRDETNPNKICAINCIIDIDVCGGKTWNVKNFNDKDKKEIDIKRNKLNSEELDIFIKNKRKKKVTAAKNLFFSHKRTKHGITKKKHKKKAV